MQLLPWPSELVAGAGRVPLRPGGWLLRGAMSKRLGAAAQRLRRHWGGAAAMPVTIRCAASAPLPALGDDESYRLVVDAAGAHIEAPEEWGVLRAFATLAQLAQVDGGGGFLPAVAIEDAPRFGWRGLMIDVARHFISLPALKRTLDAMAFHKLNVLHLHLSDDQAFRFRGDAHPELATAAGHYTRRELSALVREAAARGIRVVPELDVPGHVASWLVAHPEWGLGAIPAAPSRRFGVHGCCLNPDHPGAMRAVAALFGELAETFPDRHAHFGGDEVQLAGHGDVAALQARFNARVTQTLKRLGKTPMAWDEALHPELPRDVTIQCWRGSTALARALAAGFDAVLSAPYYLDLALPADAHYRVDPATGVGAGIAADPRFAHVSAGIERLERAWSTPAMPPLPDAAERGTVLGGEACMWTELVTDDLLDGRVWGRMPAIAERFWSPRPGVADAAAIEDMYVRLAGNQRQLARAGVLDLDAARRAGLSRLGLSGADIDALAPLIDALEPVKWYARLLGPAALKRRMEGVGEAGAERPYDADARLDRIVDVIAPESLAARALATAGRQALRAVAAGWRRQRQAFLLRRAKVPAIAELDAASAALVELAALLERHLEGGAVAVPARLTKPFGEYMLAPAQHLAGRFA